MSEDHRTNRFNAPTKFTLVLSYILFPIVLFWVVISELLIKIEMMIWQRRWKKKFGRRMNFLEEFQLREELRNKYNPFW
jgi:hypothetical protein